MTQIDTSTRAIEALLKDVTQGPWEVDWTGNGHWIGDTITTVGETYQDACDVKFIAAARELVPALLAERDALEAKVAKLRAERNHANDVADAAIEEIERLKAQAVTVKPLVWEGYWASSPYGPYSVWEGFNHESGAWCVSWSGSIVAHAHSFKEAKAAAQADYEARILSAITTRSEAEVWNEAIEAAGNVTLPIEGIGYCMMPSRWRCAIEALKRPVKGESQE